MKVLENIEKCLLMHSRNLPKGITCNEVKMIANIVRKLWRANDLINLGEVKKQCRFF